MAGKTYFNSESENGSAAHKGMTLQLPLWKTVIFSVMGVLLFLVVMEGTLALCGVRPVQCGEDLWQEACDYAASLDDPQGLLVQDPYVRFAGASPLFCEQREPDGQIFMVTPPNKWTYFNQQKFPRKKATNAYRIFCLGGSTTYGRPYNDSTSFVAGLRELLRAAQPERCWEVINAGGISYASYRVVKVMLELCAYAPDLFIIYTGHNEFLEERTYATVLQIPVPFKHAQNLLSKTRIYALLHHLLVAPSHKVPSDPRPLLPAEVDTILDRSLGPSQYHRDDHHKQKIIAHFRANLQRMIHIAQRIGADIVFITPACNLKDCAPFKNEHLPNLSIEHQQQFAHWLQQGQDYLHKHQYAQALSCLQQASRLDHRYPQVYYLRGQALYAQGKYQAALRAFRQARDEDICPLRALSSLVKIVRRTARDNKVPLVDFVKLVAQRSPHQIAGQNIFLDHVHPTLKAHFWLAQALFKILTRNGIVHPRAGWRASDNLKVYQQICKSLDPRKRGQALLNLAKVLAWAGKIEEAYHLAQQGLQYVPNHLIGLGQAGTNAHLLGKLDEAADYFRRILKLAPQDAAAHNGLGLVLRDQGKYSQALQHFQQALSIGGENATVLTNIGATLGMMGFYDKGITYLQQALRLDSRNRTTRQNMAVILLWKGSRHLAQDALQQALTCFQQAQHYNAHIARGHHLLAMTYAAMQRFPAALAAARQALRLAQSQNDWQLIALLQADIQRFCHKQGSLVLSQHVQPAEAGLKDSLPPKPKKHHSYQK